MGAINEIFRIYGPEYIRRFPNMPANHRKVIDAIIACRSGDLGQIAYRCEQCDRLHFFDRSCGNRHCPQCQQHKTNQWLSAQLDKRLPCSYFLLTWTVPEELRPFCRANQRVAYAALFTAAAAALKILAKDSRFIGTDLPGFTAILHTWGRLMQYHPHIHFIVPGGGLSSDRTAWLPSASTFFLPVRALSRIYRALFKKAMADHGLLDAIDPAVWTKDWNVNCQAMERSQGALKYLARYVYRVAITDSRIVRVTNGKVTFSYMKPGSNRPRKTTLDALEFIRRFLQHVLPTGFMKVRHYGFLSANCATSIVKIRLLIVAALKALHSLDDLLPPPKEPARCPTCSTCGGTLRYLYSIIPWAPRRARAPT